jgi:hypothetical protein
LATRRDDQNLDGRAGRGARPTGTPMPVEHSPPVLQPATDTPATDPANPYANTPGHPDAQGTLPMAQYLTDPAIEDEIQALAAEAPPMTVDQAVRLARLLRINRPRHNLAA